MKVSRRNFLRVGGIGLSAAAVSTFPLPALAKSCEPPRVAAPGGAILLNSNENPYGPLPAARAVMGQALEIANRYPDFHYTKLVEAVAKTHGVRAEQVHVACGSTEILKMAADAFASNGARLVVPDPTFEAIVHYTQAEHGNVIKVPLRPDFAHDLPAMLRAMGAGPGLFYLCNPNNPTGSLTPQNEIEDFLKQLPPRTYVLIDEAYHHFAAGAPGYKSFIDNPVPDERVFVARTFSKVYGMAGIRLGYAVGAAETIKQLDTRVLEDDVNCVAAACGIASLAATEEMLAASKRMVADRAAFLAECEKRRVKYIPTYANFAMIDCGAATNEVRKSMKGAGILVGRPFPPMDQWLRVSFGTPEEMAKFWQTFDSLKQCLGPAGKS